MARAYTSASSHKLQHDNAAATDVPLTIACWARTASTATTQAIAAIGQRATNAQRYQLFFNNTGRIAGYCQNGAGTQLSNFSDSSGVNYAANTWYHAAVVFASTTSRTVYRDGGNAGSDTTSVTVGTVTTTNFGTRFDGAAFGAYLNGQTAEGGVWNVALSAAEIASLAKGVSPLAVRPEALVAYWPMYGNNSPEDDWFGNFDLTVTGATKAAHVRIICPSSPKIILPAAAVGPTYTLTADQGSFTLTGQVAALQAARTLTAESGSFTLSGQAAGLAAGRKLLADAGTFSLTGQDAGLTYTPSGAAYTLSAEAGLFTLSGQSAALSASRVLSTDAGVYSLSGQDVEFSQAASGLTGRKVPWRSYRRGRLIEDETYWVGESQEIGEQEQIVVKSTTIRSKPLTELVSDQLEVMQLAIEEARTDKIRKKRAKDLALFQQKIAEEEEEQEVIKLLLDLMQ